MGDLNATRLFCIVAELKWAQNNKSAHTTMVSLVPAWRVGCCLWDMEPQSSTAKVGDSPSAQKVRLTDLGQVAVRMSAGGDAVDACSLVQAAGTEGHQTHHH